MTFLRLAIRKLFDGNSDTLIKKLNFLWSKVWIKLVNLGAMSANIFFIVAMHSSLFDEIKIRNILLSQTVSHQIFIRSVSLRKTYGVVFNAWIYCRSRRARALLWHSLEVILRNYFCFLSFGFYGIVRAAINDRKLQQRCVSREYREERRWLPLLLKMQSTKFEILLIKTWPMRFAESVPQPMWKWKTVIQRKIGSDSERKNDYFATFVSFQILPFRSALQFSSDRVGVFINHFYYLKLHQAIASPQGSCCPKCFSEVWTNSNDALLSSIIHYQIFHTSLHLHPKKNKNVQIFCQASIHKCHSLYRKNLIKRKLCISYG